MKLRGEKKRNYKKIVLWVLAGFLILVMILLTVTPFLVVHFATAGHVDYGLDETHPMQKIYTPEYFDLHAEALTLVTEDGLHIWASEIYTENPKAVVIYLTGIRQPSVTYYYGHSKWMQEIGYASFLLEVRGHGQSEGDKVCLGYEEVKDVRALVEFIRGLERYDDVPIVIQGVSMGGAIAINAFGEIPEIQGLIAASAYSSFEDVVCDVMAGLGIPQFLINIERPLVRWALELSFGKEASELTPIRQVEKIGTRPALLIASGDDPEVPKENMYRLLERAPDHCESWLRESEGVGHFILLDHEFENVALDTEYAARIRRFLEENIVKKPGETGE